MKPRPIVQDQDLLFKSRLSEQLNPKHELLQLAKAIEWKQLEVEFSPLFSAGAGHPPLPILLACGLMILQHMFDLSDDAEVLVSYTRGLPKGLKIALRRRQAIEPWIGHMKHDGKLGRCYLKGVIGDQIHATFVAIAHNFRAILRKLRLFCVEIRGWVSGLIVLGSGEIGPLWQAA